MAVLATKKCWNCGSDVLITAKACTGCKTPLGLASADGIAARVTPEDIVKAKRSRTMKIGVAVGALVVMTTCTGVLGYWGSQEEQRQAQEEANKRKAEEARLAAIEAAKTPEQRAMEAAARKAQAEAAAAAQKAQSEAAAKAEADRREQAKKQVVEARRAAFRAFTKALSERIDEGEKPATAFGTALRMAGKGISPGDLYSLGKVAKDKCWGASMKIGSLDVPKEFDGELKEKAEKLIKTAKQSLQTRAMAIEGFITWLDDQKPSKEAEMKEMSQLAGLATAQVVQEVIGLGLACGIPLEESTALLKTTR